MSFRLVPKSVTLNGVMAVILRYFTELVYDVIVKQLPRFQNPLFSERGTWVTFTFAVCYCPSVFRLSVVCRLSVTFVRPTQAVQIFGNISTAIGTLATHWQPLKNSRRSSISVNFSVVVNGWPDRPRGTPPPGKLNTRGVAKYSDFGPIDGYISETVQDRR